MCTWEINTRYDRAIYFITTADIRRVEIVSDFAYANILDAAVDKAYRVISQPFSSTQQTRPFRSLYREHRT